MLILIEFCKSNKASASDWIKEHLAEDPEFADAEMLEYGCLGNCAQCYMQPFAMVEGSVVAGDSLEELIDNMRNTIKKKKEEDEEWRKWGF